MTEQRDELMDQQIRDLLGDESTLEEEAKVGAEEARTAGLEVDDDFEEPEVEERDTETKGNQEPDVEEESETAKPQSDIDVLKAQNDALVQQLTAIQSHLTQQRQMNQPREAEQEQLKFDAVDFLGDANIDDLIDSKEKLNSLLNQVYQKAMSDSTTYATRQALRALPEVAMKYVHNQFDIRGAIDRFWKAHPQLENAKPAVGAIANQVDIEFPDYPMDKKLEVVAERAYKTLGIVRGAQRRAERKSPSLPGAGTRTAQRPAPAQVSEMQSVINNILSTEGV